MFAGNPQVQNKGGVGMMNQQNMMHPMGAQANANSINSMQFHSPGLHNMQNMQNSGLQRGMGMGGIQAKQVEAPFKGLGIINGQMN